MARDQLILDRYRPMAQAGAGGFGTVRIAWDTRIQRKVAIKCIELDESEVLRAQEIAAQATEKQDTAVQAAQAAQTPQPTQPKRGNQNGDTLLLGTREEANPKPASPEPPEPTEPVDSANPEGPETAPKRWLSHLPGLDEARTAATLADPNIVTVYDFEVQGSTAYLIMEYVEGVTLAQLLRNHESDLTLDMAAAIFFSVAHALEAAHDHQVLHLDIKPDNVLVNQQGQVKVTDFGLATLADANGCGTTGGGTIGYMPLEQMRQESLDARADEWALASLAYEMLTGENPFVAPSLERAEAAIEDAELVLPSLCWDNMDADMDDVLFAALDPDREERYETVSEFAEAMEPFLGDPEQGREELAALLNPAEEEPERMPAAPRPPRVPLVERISDRGGAILARIFCVAGSALAGMVASANLPWVTGWDSPLLWGLVGMCVLGAAIRPHLGALLSFSLWSVSMILAGEPLLGIALLAVTALWWWFVGRIGNAPAVAALAQPLCGAVGFAALAPLAAGCFLGVRRSLATAAFSTCTALLMSGFAHQYGIVSWISLDALAGWNPGLAIPNEFWLSTFPGIDMNGVATLVFSEPDIWCTAASWLVAAMAWSACCLRGARAFDILGACLACTVLIAGSIAAAWLCANAALWTPTPPPFATIAISYLPDAVIPGVIAIAAAIAGIPDRVRWEAETQDVRHPLG